ncbi:MAG TPA: malate dehydrogenase [Elusimicrobiota bacterium]|nr:malate dehydrogenase [Elusimicrobiota bacterium]
MRRKITVVGAGNVGATLAQRLAEKELADVVLLDIPQTEGMPAGKALDILQAGSVYGYDTKLTGATDYAAAEGSDIVVITAGVPRKPGMSRDDLLSTNAKIVKAVSEQVARSSPNAVVIVVSNPLDAMAYVALRTTRFPEERVLGMAGVLDSARMAVFVAQALDVSVEDVRPMVLGGHGDTMVPLPRYTTVAGVPVTELLSKEKIDAIVQRTRDGGAEIVKLLKTGSAYYAPSASVVAMVESILKDKKRILPCAAYLNGEYGVRGVFVGVPVKLGARGREEVLQLNLTVEERVALQKSVDAVRELVEAMQRLGVAG